MSIASDTCYECGRSIPEGYGQLARACVGMLPGRVPHWAWVDVCPQCAEQAERQRRHWLALVCVLVALLTAAVAYPLLP